MTSNDDKKSVGGSARMIAIFGGTVLLALVFYGGVLVLFYGITVIIFRLAFGIELPNPFDWL